MRIFVIYPNPVFQKKSLKSGERLEAAETGTGVQTGKNDSGFIETIHFFFNVIFSPISFFTSINGDEGKWCLCLPDLEQYRKILDMSKEYFASNKMHLKVYFVNQNGSVDVFYLK